MNSVPEFELTQSPADYAKRVDLEQGINCARIRIDILILDQHGNILLMNAYNAGKPLRGSAIPGLDLNPAEDESRYLDAKPADKEWSQDLKTIVQNMQQTWFGAARNPHAIEVLHTFDKARILLRLDDDRDDPIYQGSNAPKMLEVVVATIVEGKRPKPIHDTAGVKWCALEEVKEHGFSDENMGQHSLQAVISLLEQYQRSHIA